MLTYIQLHDYDIPTYGMDNAYYHCSVYIKTPTDSLQDNLEMPIEYIGASHDTKHRQQFGRLVNLY